MSVTDVGAVHGYSVLTCRPEADAACQARDQPPFFRDLHLDQVVARITADWKEYDLAPFYYAGPLEHDVIAYRQEVMQELERDEIRVSVVAFSERMRAMRLSLGRAKERGHRYERERRFLSAAQAYCEGVEQFAAALQQSELHSRALASFRSDLGTYVASPSFHELAFAMRTLVSDLSSLRFGLHLSDSSVTVLHYSGQLDYTVAVEEAFATFRREKVQQVEAADVHSGPLNHVEAQVLDRVARLHPTLFAALDAFCTVHADFQEVAIARFDREIHFYLAYLTHIAKLRGAGLSFCYPRLTETRKEVDVRDGFDLALASKLVAEQKDVVRNDFVLRDPERVFVVTGPNQGGKTTFARMFGQLHHLASLGCPVPGTDAELFLFDRLFVHFARVEDIATLRGRLQDDLVRMHATLAQATPKSIIITNELFASTTYHDAVYLTREILGAIGRLDLIAVFVTFLDDLGTQDARTVSMVAGVDPDDRTKRTFRLARRPSDGLAYALALAEKHRVTYDWIKRRRTA